MCAKYVPICQSKPLNGVMDLHLENHFPRSFFFHKVPFGHVNEGPLWRIYAPLRFLDSHGSLDTNLNNIIFC